MKTKEIMKTLALPLMAAAAMMTASCSSEDNVIDPQPAAPQNTIHVTLNAQMADDASTRATYGYEAVNAADRKVTIENGDKLHVYVVGPSSAWTYYGVLNNSAGALNTFSGDLTWASGTYSGSNIIKDSYSLYATLLPIGYESIGFLTVNTSDIETNYTKAFADGDFSSKVPLVNENVCNINNAANTEKNVILSLDGAVLCFTINGLTPNTDHHVSLWNGEYPITGTTTANSSGIATFSVGYAAVSGNTYTLSIDGYEPINLGSKNLVARHLYKITRTAVPVGAVPGKFSVAADKQVYFSKGNLMYVGGATNKWQLHANQYDYCEGDANATVNTTTTSQIASDKTFDLFGWATSGYNGKNPWMTSTSSYGQDYGPSGNITGANGNYDWGVRNQIYLSDGTTSTGTAGTWRTLTSAEWYYLSNYRTNASSKWGRATIASDFEGLVLLPDDWTLPTGLSFTAAGKYNSNSYSAAQWAKMEAAGAVFLPAAGMREETTIYSVSLGINGCYWSSTAEGDNYAIYFDFDNSYVRPSYNDYRYFGLSVRLVQDAN